MEDSLLKQAKSLYQDRIRIVLSLLIIGVTVTVYVFYSSGIVALIQDSTPQGWTAGLEVVVSYNTFGFALALILMVLGYRFWTQAFLPSPATVYTLGVLRGILGPRASIKMTLGRRFRVTLPDGSGFVLRCTIHDRGSNEWFLYHVVSTEINTPDIRSLALRHGFGVENRRLIGTVSHEELHARTALLAKALSLASES
ncbi:MAG: hypothetical protein DRO87_10620 [Candidatus Thorarchaeota archaeon]|nr:MAG: hypothetical protein DRO87_10620 [Candidatus Thorarchaeota archaeon]RLI57175.1 MAG: hypothetical protein DRP09_04020 [Candidatus Thorarchaeota archaeon]